ncbi:MAG: hypothetical protein EOP90_12315 [Lysobacteraceae bacterium]|nr:MAG: hypothetical protein EOP90_12315 [Xanthomonadaceae bacterium]
MNTTRMLAHAALAAFLASASMLPTATASSEAQAIRTSAELVPATAFAPGSVARGSDPVIYSHVSATQNLTGDPVYPHLGTAFDYEGAGPQVSVTGVRFYIHSRTAQAFDRVRATIQFWNHHDPAVSPVFSLAPKPERVVVDLYGPFNLDADTAYAAEAMLPKAMLLEGIEATGISMQVTAGPFSTDHPEAPPVEQATLLPAYDTGVATVVGTDLAHYGELDGRRGDFNFAQTDLLPDKPLAITLFGRSERRVQCGDWPRHLPRLVEEFDPATFDARWRYEPNAGNVAPTIDGGYVLENTATSNAFPYVWSRSSPIPADGEFSVRWLARYLTAGTNGTGTMVLSRGHPDNGSIGDNSDIAMRVWQDSGGFRAIVRDGADTDPPPVFQEPAGADSITHDIEYCWLDETVELWVDGDRVMQLARGPEVPRPDTIWFGNHGHGGDVPPSGWNAFETYRIRVHTPWGDAIFANGFEAPLNPLPQERISPL